MKSRLWQFSCLCLLLVTRLSAQAQEPAPALLMRPPEQLDQLFGPIALYPDALVALILPSATVPSDVVLAARYLEDKGDPAKIDEQEWDDSVKSLAHYPDVVKWMDQNLSWTKQAGEAFLAQPADVMNAVQRLRGRAKTAGTLVDTPQQQIIVEEENIRIMPTQPDVIYVPVYDPEIVYVSRSGFYHDPYLTFGVGYATGFWLGYDFDWGRRRIWTIDRHDRERYWHDHGDWRHRSYPGRPGYVNGSYQQHNWRPSSNYPRPSRPGYHPRPDIARPSPYNHSSADRYPGSRRGGNDHSSGDRNSRPPTAGGRSDSQPNRRPGNSPAPATAPANITPARVPTPAAPSIHAQPPQSQPAAQYRREDRQDRGQRGRDRNDAAGNPSVRQGRPVSPAPATSQPSSPASVQPQSRPSSPPPASAQVSPSTSSARSVQADRESRPARSQNHRASGRDRE